MRGVMGVLEAFRRDRKHWGESDYEVVRQFYAMSSFFNRLDAPLVRLLEITCFAELSKPLVLEQNTLSELVVVLGGTIVLQQRKRLPIQYTCEGAPISIPLHSRVEVSGVGEAYVLYVPTRLYMGLVSELRREQSAVVEEQLRGVYPEMGKGQRVGLASECGFQSHRMFQEIYGVGGVPDAVYVLLDGTVRSGGALISLHGVFGDKDIGLGARVTNAVAYTAQTRVLRIPKEAYGKYLQKYCTRVTVPNTTEDTRPTTQQIIQRLPKFVERAGSVASEIKMYRNCHMMISTPRKGKKAFRSPESGQRNCSVDPFQEKFKFVKRRRPNTFRIDIKNKLF